MADLARLVRGTMPTAAAREVVATVEGLSRGRQALDAELIATAARAWSPNTIRAFLSDLKLWNGWCRRRGVAAAQAGPQELARYLRELGGIERHPHAPIERRAAATIERYLVSIGWAYRMAGVDSPTAAPLVRLELKAVRKAVGTRQAQARGIRFKGEIEVLDDPATGVCLANLIKASRRDVLGARDRALLLVAYDSGCRRSELVALQCDDVEGPVSDGSGTLLIRSSKTDQTGRGVYAYLSPAAMRAVVDWRERAELSGGALFRRVRTYFDGSVRSVEEGPLHPNSVTLIYRRLVRAAFDKRLLGEMTAAELGKWVRAVSSHSIRVGVAQDNLAASESLPAIMQAYRWRDPKMVMRYGAKLAARSGASARLAKRLAGDRL